MKAKLEREKNPEVQFLADLDKYDRTEVAGRDPKKHYRWCSAEKIGLRTRQGYTKCDDPNLQPAAPGGSVCWPAEGKQAGNSNKDLILMEMPLERFKMRQEYKAKMAAERDRIERADMARKASEGDAASLFVPEGEFLKDLGG